MEKMKTTLRLTLAAATFLLWLASIDALAKSQHPAVQGLNDHRLHTLLVDAPSLKLHVTLKRKSMHVHGQSEFDVFADPVVSNDGKEVLYDGYAIFVEDDKDLTYMFTNGVFFVVERSVDKDDETDREPTVRCLPTALPFDAILPALNDITPIPSASIGGDAVNCSSGNLFKTTFSGANFAVCALGASGLTAHSSDMTIEVTYLDNPISISEPELTEGASSCAATAKPITVTPTALALMTGDDIPESTSRKLKAAEHMAMEAATCECKSTPRPCIIFHGIGVTNDKAELQDKPSARMGSIDDHAPCCTVVKYAHLNTMDYGWTNDTLQEKFCHHALSVSKSSDQTSDIIDNTIIVTHSMAGATMAAALASGKCSFGFGTDWVALSSPMTGSILAGYAQDICNDKLGTFVADMLDVIGQCPLAASRQSLLYEGEKYTSATLNAAYIAAQEAYSGNVSAAMCSNNYRGVVSIYKSIFVLAGKVIPHKSPENDGLVEFQSCAKGLDSSVFGSSYTDQWYMPKLNHADTAFMTSDGWFDDAQKPYKWFECLL